MHQKYEQALLAIRQLGLGIQAIEQQFRRMTFNVVARNQDDHVKNIAFLMDRDGTWSLSPAFDLTFAWEPANRWLDSHQMTVNTKREGFTLHDLRAVADAAGMKRGRAETIYAEVRDAVALWREFANRADVEADSAERMAGAHRLDIPAG